MPSIYITIHHHVLVLMHNYKSNVHLPVDR
jgi:hypothetical protein